MLYLYGAGFAPPQEEAVFCTFLFLFFKRKIIPKVLLCATFGENKFFKLVIRINECYPNLQDNRLVYELVVVFRKLIWRKDAICSLWTHT